MGTPQRRRRIYLVADFGSERVGEILFKREGLRGYFEKSGETRKGTSANTQGCVGADDSKRSCIAYGIENHPNDSRVNIDESGKCQTLTSRMGTGGGNVPMVMEQRKVYAVDQGGGKSSCNVSENLSPTLTCTHGGEPAVAYGFYPQMKAESVAWIKEKANCLVNGTNPGFHNGACITDPQYIVRRLTPTECARLQGFPDNWGHPSKKLNLPDEEYAFWLDVRKTDAEINGKQIKEWTRAQILSWYNKLHTDSAEYKMWGNGIALPNALYVMQGIAEVSRREKDGNE